MARIETVIYTDYEQKVTIGLGDTKDTLTVDVQELDGSKFSRLYLSREDMKALMHTIETTMNASDIE